MKMEDIQAAFKRLPLLIGPDGYAPGVNEPVLLYRGDLSLQLETGTLPVDGEVFFSWRPRPGVRFRGAIDRYTLDFDVKNIDLPGKRTTHGQAMITHIGGADGSVTGVINNPFIFKVQESAGRLS
ncbi:hypothetical protein SAMN05216464_10835 [Mucilaginibacter pineti]|uniref:Uncharacterized protein n=1 Tax=Mucilaginibacter pineti TaxID=1391627 RepID=A0A1G7EI25_9SPHI|nr:hypothetical protein [Mucilaginibacter pineti]SDE63293.1 hypothetical protein SAMN05216464_10835 [Mucilaginibacter pineti]